MRTRLFRNSAPSEVLRLQSGTVRLPLSLLSCTCLYFMMERFVGGAGFASLSFLSWMGARRAKQSYHSTNQSARLQRYRFIYKHRYEQ